MFSASLDGSSASTRSWTLNPEGLCACVHQIAYAGLFIEHLNAYHAQAQLQKNSALTSAPHIVGIWNTWGRAEKRLYMSRPWAARVGWIIIMLIHLDQSIAIHAYYGASSLPAFERLDRIQTLLQLMFETVSPSLCFGYKGKKIIATIRDLVSLSSIVTSSHITCWACYSNPFFCWSGNMVTRLIGHMWVLIPNVVNKPENQNCPIQY